MSKSRLALLAGGGLRDFLFEHSFLSNLTRPVLPILMGFGSTFARFVAAAIVEALLWEMLEN